MNIGILDMDGPEIFKWKYNTDLEEVIHLAYKDFLENPMRAEM